MEEDADVARVAANFPPIADYGFLSDCEVSCLVAPDGSIEWLCLPRPDSPSIFGALLDRTAGNFRFGPMNTHVPHHRRYVPGTMVLETTWHTPTGWLLVEDFLVVQPLRRRDPPPRLQASPGRFRAYRDAGPDRHLHRGSRRGGGQCGAGLRVRPQTGSWDYDGDGYER